MNKATASRVIIEVFNHEWTFESADGPDWHLTQILEAHVANDQWERLQEFVSEFACSLSNQQSATKFELVEVIERYEGHYDMWCREEKRWNYDYDKQEYVTPTPPVDTSERIGK